ncbi:unnamed protein product [Amoebophrya sp. A120]|nr:unnamed protein product [Amoebophrya sp. A120]|eukprot:GSA120T00015199001.1
MEANGLVDVWGSIPKAVVGRLCSSLLLVSVTFQHHIFSSAQDKITADGTIRATPTAPRHPVSLVQQWCTSADAVPVHLAWASQHAGRFFLADEKQGAIEHMGVFQERDICPQDLYSDGGGNTWSPEDENSSTKNVATCCQNSTDLRLAHEELVHKWQFINRNFNDRLDSHAQFLAQTGHLSDEYCATHLIKSRIQSFQMTNKLQEQWAALLLATESFVLCATCFPPISDSATGLGPASDMGTMKPAKDEDQDDPTSGRTGGSSTAAEIVEKEHHHHDNKYSGAVGADPKQRITSESSTEAHLDPRHNREKKLLEHWKRASEDAEEVWRRQMMTDAVILEQDDQCRFAYVEELQRGRIFESKHLLPHVLNYPQGRTAVVEGQHQHERAAGEDALNDTKMDRKTSAKADHHMLNQDDNLDTRKRYHSDEGEAGAHHQVVDLTYGHLYANAFKPWVDATMSLILEVGNLLLHQTETLLLLLYHLQKGEGPEQSWAHALLIVPPQTRADLKALFVQRQQVLDAEVPLCRVLRDYDRAIVQGVPGGDQSLLASLNRAMQMSIGYHATAAADRAVAAAAAAAAVSEDNGNNGDDVVDSASLLLREQENLGAQIQSAMGDVGRVVTLLENILPWEPPCFLRWPRPIEGGTQVAQGDATGATSVDMPTATERTITITTTRSGHETNSFGHRQAAERKSFLMVAIPDGADEALVRAHAQAWEEFLSEYVVADGAAAETAMATDRDASDSSGRVAEKQLPPNRNMQLIVVSRSSNLAALWPTCQHFRGCVLLWRRFFLYTPCELMSRFAEPDQFQTVYRVPELGLESVDLPKEHPQRRAEIDATIQDFRQVLVEEVSRNRSADKKSSLTPLEMPTTHSCDSFSSAAMTEVLAMRPPAREITVTRSVSSSGQMGVLVEENKRSDLRMQEINKISGLQEQEGVLSSHHHPQQGQADYPSLQSSTTWRHYNLRHWQQVESRGDDTRGESGALEKDNVLLQFIKQNQKSERVLVYRCASIGFCGGHGDRLHGILGLFMLALVTNRAFYIDSPRPLPIGLLLEPTGLVDWRLRGSVGLPGLHANRNDKLEEAIADVRDSPEKHWVLHSNQRITMPCLQSDLARKNLPSKVREILLSTPFLHAHLFEVLFQPTNLLSNRIAIWFNYVRDGPIYTKSRSSTSPENQHLSPGVAQLKLPRADNVEVSLEKSGAVSASELPNNNSTEKGIFTSNITKTVSASSSSSSHSAERVDYYQHQVHSLIGIHFRAGNASSDRWRDPQRHQREELAEFLACASQVESDLRLDPRTTRFFLAADAETEDWPELADWYESGKLIGPSFHDPVTRQRFSNAVVHLDRSSLALLAVGMAEVWAQWYALGFFTEALVLSASGFGATAAEIGRQTHTWFGKGCIRADMSAT